MHPALREAASRVTARVVASRFAKPIARVVLVAAGLLLLALIGRTAVASAPRPPPDPPPPALAPASPPTPSPAQPPALALTPALAVPAAADPASSRASSTQATPDDPVFLNSANIDDLRRLPGIGEKRATSIVALRTRLGGHFRAVEDLLKVKGIGRTTLRRLRPLVRLDPPTAPPADAGPTEAPR